MHKIDESGLYIVRLLLDMRFIVKTKDFIKIRKTIAKYDKI